MRDVRRCVLAAAVVATAAFAGVALAADDADTARVGFIQIRGKPATQAGPLDWLKGHDPEEPSLREIIDGLKHAATDDSVGGVVVRLKDAELNASMIEEIGSAMKQARAAGKKVHVFAENFGPAEIMLGSYADDAIAQDGGAVSLPGMYMEEMFLADTLNWVGVKADMVQIGDYKGASEAMARNAPSPQWEQNISQLLDSLYGNMRAKIKAGRHLDDAGLDKAMNESWMAEAGDAVRLHLVDSAIDLPRLDDHLKETYGKPIAWDYHLVSSDDGSTPGMEALANPFMLLQKLMKKPDHTPKGPTIAVLHIQGVIVDGDSESGGLLGGERSVGSRTIRNAVEEIMEQDDIRGVVVRIDSPGGSATASEIMWQGLRRLGEKKPVWVSVGGMAASGGYYCAVGGQKIYVNPSSIVGSIGVVGGRLSLAGLYEKLKVNVVSRTRGPRAGMFRSTTNWSPDELAAVKQKMTQTYALFTKRVSGGRPGIDLATTAEGRLFTGDKAIGLKMADAVGGLDDCIRDMAAHLGLDDPDIMDYPGPRSLEETLHDMFGAMAMAPGASAPGAGQAGLAQLAAAAREVVGPRAWPAVAEAMRGMMLLRDEHVILMSPKIIILK